MRKVIIMSGISGAGKSTYIQDVILGRKVVNNVTSFNPPPSFMVVSADDYFIGEDGVYKFDPSKLSDAHGHCFRCFIDAMQSECDLVVVDNTNTTTEELAPYILGAQAYGYEVEIRTLWCGMDLAASRNTHGVSERGIEAQWVRLNSRKLLPWWKNTDINVPHPEGDESSAHRLFAL